VESIDYEKGESFRLAVWAVFTADSNLRGYHKIEKEK
jgi:hypothetical protein